MSVKLLTEHHLEFLSLKGGCTGSSESTLVKIPHCLKSCVVAHMPMPLHSQHPSQANIDWAFTGGLIMALFFEPVHEISNNAVCATSKGSDQPVHRHRLFRAFASRLNIL